MSGELFETGAETYLDIAVPVPLRRTFTYRVPRALAGKVVPGMRVAVPFGPRKLAGFVLGPATAPPPGTRIKDIAGLLDPLPLFSDELLRFLIEAADYYLHPLGEVLRAAAPALPSEAMSALRKDGFLGQGESLPGTRIATRSVLIARLREGAPLVDVKLGKSQRVLVALLSERGEVTLDELRRHVANPRGVLRALAEKDLVTTATREVAADRFFEVEARETNAPQPNAAQAAAIAAIVARPRRKGARFLLHGITGSGKTEVYLRVIAEARARGLGALVLVPEIALTPQLVSRFRARFGDDSRCCTASCASASATTLARAAHGRVALAVGARSALFAPVAAPGRGRRRRGARRLVQARGRRSLQRARHGAAARASRRRGVRARLRDAVARELPAGRARQADTARAARARHAQPLPPVEIVDLARTAPGRPAHRVLSAPLAIARSTSASARRAGDLVPEPARLLAESCAATRAASCAVPGCAWRSRCTGRARCCAATTATSARPHTGACSECGVAALDRTGHRHRAARAALTPRSFPRRAWRGSIATRRSGEGVEAVLERMRSRQVDMLVGTQMVTKGHDVPGVTLVGVIHADQSLAFPDFRAAERTFQLLAQVAGRAGRGERPGKVILQTYQPDHASRRLRADARLLRLLRERAARSSGARVSTVRAPGRGARRRRFRACRAGCVGCPRALRTSATRGQSRSRRGARPDARADRPPARALSLPLPAQELGSARVASGRRRGQRSDRCGGCTGTCHARCRSGGHALSAAVPMPGAACLPLQGANVTDWRRRRARVAHHFQWPYDPFCTTRTSGCGTLGSP